MADEKKTFWGKGVVIFTSAFVLLILSMVIYVSFQNFDLVEKDYYSKEVAYQNQIERIQNANELIQKPTFVFNGAEKMIVVKFPDSLSSLITGGRVHLFRPSDKRYDEITELKLDQSGLQMIPFNRVIKGLWKIKIDWRTDEKEYYLEDMLIIG